MADMRAVAEIPFPAIASFARRCIYAFGIFAAATAVFGADFIFKDVATTSGIEFNHFNGMTGSFTIAEITGQGLGLVDYDNDGDLDVYLVQGALLGKKMSEAVFPFKGTQAPIDRLYRNDLEINKDGKRTLHFTDVTAVSGIMAKGYGMGVASGDFDNDGWTDLYITNLGANQLFRNQGDGSFVDVTNIAGVAESRWSTCAAFLDYDRDGDLDLFVANYVDFESDPKRVCYNNSSARDFCGPSAYNPVRDSLFRNRGDGTFENVSVAAGIDKEFGAGFGVVASDLNGDGWLDIYVANDGDPNQLWINKSNGTFQNDALWCGAAVNDEGMAEASMGLDAADFDGDGDDDLFMTHIMEETNTLYVNDGTGVFEDRTASAGLATISRGKTGFGTGWFDYDNDGWLDLLVLNGAVRALAERVRTGDPYPLGQPNQLLRNLGNSRFKVISDRAGPSFSLIEVSRGAAFGDVDNDGDMDILVANNNGPARLLINLVGTQNAWLGIRLLLKDATRDALGARVEVVPVSGPSIWRRVRSDGSFCSTRDSRVLIGLGKAKRIKAVNVVWPNGKKEAFPAQMLNTYVTIQEGSAPKER
ncbi:MAG: CRTAC1 family protein [bacterium]|nr:CRTAC1 family protein [bacterium]